MTATRYGVTASTATVPKARRRRHVVWAKHAGKCGAVLVAELADGDDALPVCGLCRKSLARLDRERARPRPRVAQGYARW